MINCSALRFRKLVAALLVSDAALYAVGGDERLSDELSGAMDEVAAELSDTGHPSPLYKEIATQSQRRLEQLV